MLELLKNVFPIKTCVNISNPSNILEVFSRARIIYSIPMRLKKNFLEINS